MSLLLQSAINYANNKIKVFPITVNSNPQQIRLFDMDNATTSIKKIERWNCSSYGVCTEDKLIPFKVNRNEEINPELKFEGILPTMVTSRAVITKKLLDHINNVYGKDFRIFKSMIPQSIKGTESNMYGINMIKYDKNSKIAKAYNKLAQEVLADE